MVARIAEVTRKRAREALLATHDGEWHHVGKYASECNYYSIDAAVAALDPLAEEIEAVDSAERFAQGWLELGEPQLRGRYREYGMAGIGVPMLRQLNLLSAADERIEIAEVEDTAAQIQHAANFRRWEQALRRMADVC